MSTTQHNAPVPPWQKRCITCCNMIAQKTKDLRPACQVAFVRLEPYILWYYGSMVRNLEKCWHVLDQGSTMVVAWDDKLPWTRAAVGCNAHQDTLGTSYREAPCDHTLFFNIPRPSSPRVE